MKDKANLLKPINELEMFEYTYLYYGKYEEDQYEAVITRVHNGYLYRYWYNGESCFVPYNEYLK